MLGRTSKLGSTVCADSGKRRAIETETAEVKEDIGDVPLGENIAVEPELDTVQIATMTGGTPYRGGCPR